MEEEERKQEAELRRQVEERERQERERNWPTAFGEFILYCHQPLRVEAPFRSIIGTIPSLIGKYCYIVNTTAPMDRLCFNTTRNLCVGLSLSRTLNFLKKGLVSNLYFDRLVCFTIKDYIYDIILELYNILVAYKEFRLGDDFWHKIIESDTIPIYKAEKLNSNTARLAGPWALCSFI
ncbi:hypothetical protein N7488_012342 [Penicillium malachiteum]|nr:hypothetical protein N7488_012342 [Penicillium malachiteum]